MSLPPSKTETLPVVKFQQVASILLLRHYGLDLNDTHLWDELIVSECISQGYRPYQVINEHARETELVRIDVASSFPYCIATAALLTEQDESRVLDSRNAWSFLMRNSTLKRIDQ